MVRLVGGDAPRSRKSCGGVIAPEGQERMRRTMEMVIPVFVAMEP
jgi:hypothetical protein